MTTTTEAPEMTAARAELTEARAAYLASDRTPGGSEATRYDRALDACRALSADVSYPKGFPRGVASQPQVVTLTIPPTVKTCTAAGCLEWVERLPDGPVPEDPPEAELRAVLKWCAAYGINVDYQGHGNTNGYPEGAFTASYV
jgi:hypothetical protein